jgi:hypothetical protein
MMTCRQFYYDLPSKAVFQMARFVLTALLLEKLNQGQSRPVLWVLGLVAASAEAPLC